MPANEFADTTIHLTLQGKGGVGKSLVAVNLRSVRKRPTERTRALAGTSNRHSASDRSMTFPQMTSSTIFDGGFRLAFKSRPLPELFKKIGLSRRQYIKNCGSFAEC